MKRLLAVIVAALVLGLVGAPAHAEKHKDEKLGYSFVYPKKWKSLPLASDTEWVVGKFIAPRDYEWQKGNDWAWMKPWIEVVVIPFAALEDGGATVEKTDKGVNVKREVPFKNLRDYMEERCRRIGGFFFAEEEETEVGGMKCMQYKVTVDKLVSGERTVYGWEYHTEDAMYGFVGEVFQKDEDKKIGKAVLKAFKSFKAFQRTGALPHTARTGDDIVVEPSEDEDDRTDEEKRDDREALTKRTIARIKENLGKDWSLKESKNFIAVSHVDKKYTKSTLNHAEALRAWLEKNLGYVGSGEVGKMIIRICADNEEYTAYQSSRKWSSDTPEIVTYEDKRGWSDWAVQSLNSAIWRRWVKEKNEKLLWGAPRFISDGLLETISNANSKGRKIEFPADEWAVSEMRKLRRSDELLKARDFFNMTSDELFGEGYWRQNQFMIKFLLVGRGSKSGKYKTVLGDYMRNLLVLLDEAAEEEDESEGSDEPTTEEEEDQMYKERAQAWRKKEREVLDRLMAETFEGWTEKDWKAMNALYWKDVK